MKSHLLIALAAVLAAGACQKSEPADGPAAAAATTAPAGSAEAVTRILAMPVIERCGAEIPGAPQPTRSEVIDLGQGVFAVVADCPAMPGEAVMQTLHVQGADGVLKYQPLLVYNGAGYDPEYTWEGTHSAPLTWDAATSQLVSVYKTAAVPGDDAVKESEATIRWRWAGDHFAMVSSSFAVKGTPDGPFAVNGAWPTTPPTEDPTAPLQPVA